MSAAATAFLAISPKFGCAVDEDGVVLGQRLVGERIAQPAVQRGEVIGRGDQLRREPGLDVGEVAVRGDQVEMTGAAAQLAEHPGRGRQQDGGVFHRVAVGESVVPVLDRLGRAAARRSTRSG